MKEAENFPEQYYFHRVDTSPLFRRPLRQLRTLGTTLLIVDHNAFPVHGIAPQQQLSDT